MQKKLPRRPCTAPSRVIPLGRDQISPSSPFYVVWVKGFGNNFGSVNFLLFTNQFVCLIPKKTLLIHNCYGFSFLSLSSQLEHRILFLKHLYLTNDFTLCIQDHSVYYLQSDLYFEVELIVLLCITQCILLYTAKKN